MRKQQGYDYIERWKKLMVEHVVQHTVNIILQR